MRTLGLLLVLGALAYTLYPDLLTKLAKLPVPAPAPASPTKKEDEPVPEGENGDHLFPDDLKG